MLEILRVENGFSVSGRIFKLVGLAAYSAVPPTLGSPIDILRRELMAVLTMGLGSLEDAAIMLLAASPQVLTMSHGFQVIRPHAKSVLAEVIPLQPFRGPAYEECVGLNGPSLIGKLAVSARVLGCLPFPATILQVAQYLSVEAFMWTKLRKHREPSFLGVVRQAVSAVLPPSILAGVGTCQS